MEGDNKNALKDNKIFRAAVIGIAIVAVLGFFVWLASNASSNQPGGSSTAALSKVATVPSTNLAINTFEVKKDATICTENGKPIVYLMSTASCPHCQWIKETFDKVAREYEAAGKIKAYHFDVETGDDLLTSTTEASLTPAANQAYSEFSPEGYIPTFVFGCKYFRIGNGYESEGDLGKEETEFRAVIDDLIANNK